MITENQKSTDALLEKHGILKYRGNLIFPERGKYWYRGIAYDSLIAAHAMIDHVVATKQLVRSRQHAR